MPPLTALRLVFSGIWIVVFSYAAFASTSFPSISGMYPLVVSVAGLVLALTTFLLDLYKWRKNPDVIGAEANNSSTAAFATADGPGVGRAFLRAGRFGLWLLGLMALAATIGLVPAAGVFIFVFLLVEAKAKWPLLVGGPIVTVALLLVLADAINLFWPPSLITIV